MVISIETMSIVWLGVDMVISIANASILWLSSSSSSVLVFYLPRTHLDLLPHKAAAHQTGSYTTIYMVVSRCWGIGPPAGIIPSGLLFCWPPAFRRQLTPAHPFPVSSVVLVWPVHARGFCHSPRRLLASPLYCLIYIYKYKYIHTYIHTCIHTYRVPGYTLALPPFNREEPLYESFSRGGGQFL